MVGVAIVMLCAVIISIVWLLTCTSGEGEVETEKEGSVEPSSLFSSLQTEAELK
jgi:hypothetical protein